MMIKSCMSLLMTVAFAQSTSTGGAPPLDQYEPPASNSEPLTKPPTWLAPPPVVDTTEFRSPDDVPPPPPPPIVASPTLAPSLAPTPKPTSQPTNKPTYLAPPPVDVINSAPTDFLVPPDPIDPAPPAPPAPAAPPVPTPNPTTAPPTLKPTLSPTPSPTLKPTLKPTLAPSTQGDGCLAGQCTDSNSNCAFWSSQGECSINPAFMKTACRASCCSNSCTTKPAPATTDSCPAEGGCSDNHGSCQFWAGLGECSKNPGWMQAHCRSSCCPSKCAAGSTAAAAAAPTTDSCPTTGSCKDEHSSCQHWAAVGECSKNPGWMQQFCRSSCCPGKCPTNVEAQDTCPTIFADTCEDEHKSCAFWASLGECSKNPGFMQVKCRASCCPGKCGGTDFRSGN